MNRSGLDGESPRLAPQETGANLRHQLDPILS
jgi:hypothetical protein